ncbi:MAG: FtsH protease activity modulator HflK [Gammaproteobacteria bacterium]|nr:FtsH protease activity modulator HflK [Gammaproteobacteria bacterium]
MAWNEPGNNDKDPKDPWSGRKKDSGPPDIDEALRSLQEKFSGIFGGGGNSGGSGGSPGSWGGIGMLGTILALLWLATGFYIVDAGVRGVETRFGAYTVTTDPGLHWHFPWPFEQVTRVDVKSARFIEIGYRSTGGGRIKQSQSSITQESLMLTQDENYVDVQLAVQYVIKDPKAYLFNVFDPKMTLKQIVQSAEREVVGTSTLDFVLTEGRSEVVAAIELDSQRMLDEYQTGIQITSVNLVEAQPPEQVQAAFQDVVKAREDRERVINEAQAYSREVLPRAQGESARQLQNAEGYRARVVAEATGRANRFSQLLLEYQRAPRVTRERLYLESMEKVLGNSQTIMVDVKSGNSLMYLPLDQLTQKKTRSQQSTRRKTMPQSSQVIQESSQPIRQSSRIREGRVR